MKNLLLALFLTTLIPKNLYQPLVLCLPNGLGAMLATVPDVDIDTKDYLDHPDETIAYAAGYNNKRPVMPPNDVCANAIPITPAPAGASCTVSSFTLPFSTDGTTDSGVATACSEPAADQWFTWTATTAGLNFLRANTAGGQLLTRRVV
ncbi:MAG: hypothetical protein AAFZ52_15615 [Bacteroidota bacterium]